jgi:hypothetical protein
MHSSSTVRMASCCANRPAAGVVIGVAVRQPLTESPPPCRHRRAAGSLLQNIVTAVTQPRFHFALTAALQLECFSVSDIPLFSCEQRHSKVAKQFYHCPLVLPEGSENNKFQGCFCRRKKTCSRSAAPHNRRKVPFPSKVTT